MEEEFLEWTRQFIDNVHRDNNTHRVFREYSMERMRDTIYYVKPWFGDSIELKFNLKRKYRKNCKI